MAHGSQGAAGVPGHEARVTRAAGWWVVKAFLFVVLMHACFLVAALCWEKACENKSGYIDPMPKGLQ